MSDTTLRFTFASASRLAHAHTARLSGEPLGVYQQRVDNAACTLLRASRQQGSKLHRFLTVTHRFYPVATRNAELDQLAVDTLLVQTPLPQVPAYAIEAMRVAG